MEKSNENDKMTNRNYVDYIWHFKVEDNLPWSFCSGYMEQNGHKITANTLKNKFCAYFKNEVGIEPYKKCPKCGEKLLPRKSVYGYFVGCSGFPNCKFIATYKKPYDN